MVLLKCIWMKHHDDSWCLWDISHILSSAESQSPEYHCDKSNLFLFLLLLWHNEEFSTKCMEAITRLLDSDWDVPIKTALTCEVTRCSDTTGTHSEVMECSWFYMVGGCQAVMTYKAFSFFFTQVPVQCRYFAPSNTPWLLLKDDRSISKKVRVVSFFQTADSACHLYEEKAGEFLIFLSTFNR